MFQLVNPSEEYKDSYLKALDEYESVGESLSPTQKLAREDFNKFLGKLAFDNTEHTDEVVPNIQYWCVEAGEYLGRISYRPILNEKLKKMGGNMGYTVRPSARKRGVASFMLEEIKKLAKQDGLTKLIVTCDVENIGSNKTIQKGGGALQATEKDEKGVLMNRYIIGV